MPDITVIVPVYNAESTIVAALSSVLSQTDVNAEFVVIDDGSSDLSANIIMSLLDERVRFYQRPNKGLSATLNEGLGYARGRYIARLDADDRALPGRLGKQFRHLEANPATALLGTWAEIFSDEQPTGRFHRHPTSNSALKLALMFDNPFVHSSVMFRRDVVEKIGGYDSHGKRAYPEDYSLWSKISEHHNVENLPEVLTIYNETPNSITRTNRAEIAIEVAEISALNIYRSMGSEGRLNEIRSFSLFYHGLSKITVFEYWSAIKLLKTVAFAIERSNKIDEEFLNNKEHLHYMIRRRVLSGIAPKFLKDFARFLRSKNL